METIKHSLANLFAQLGLASDEASIQTFIASHSPLADEVELSCAPFWSTAQAALLRESLKADADWAIVTDQLSQRLRANH